MLKAVILNIFLFIPTLIQGATVAGPIGCLIGTNNANSTIYEYYVLNSAGINVQPLTYNLNGKTITTDGELIIKGKIYYCGKTGADELLQYAILTKQ